MEKSSDPAAERTTQLPPDAMSRVIKEARKEGVFAGLSSGLASAVIGQKLMGFNRNKTFLCGALSAVAAGYLFTQAFIDTAIAQLRAEERRLSIGGPSLGNSPPRSA